MKKFLNLKTIDNLKKHPLIVLFTIILIIIGAIQSITWTYDRFLKYDNPLRDFETNILSNITPGNNFNYVIEYLGPYQKSFALYDAEGNEQENKMYMWSFENSTIGILKNEGKNTIMAVALYSYNCKYDIHIPQLGFTLCKDKLPKLYGYNEWDSFYGAQNIGYIEENQAGRPTSYLTPYFGSNLDALKLVRFADENYEYIENFEKKLLNSNDEILNQIIEYRNEIIPNFIMISEYSMSAKNVMEYFDGICNFRFL